MIQLLRFVRNISSRHLLRRTIALKYLADWVIPDFRLTWPQLDWWHDRNFNAFLDRFGERRDMNTHRHWMLKELVRLISSVPGDTAECGVFRGAGSWSICQAGRTHHLFDSFEGMSAPGAFDGKHWNFGDLCGSEETVRKNLQPFLERIVFHKGWIPEAFPEVTDKSFAFVHIDVDLYQPTSDSIDFFYPRLERGGILLCDDYGMTTCPGATRAIDEYLCDKPEKMIRLDAGGGFLIKGTPVRAQSDEVRPDMMPDHALLIP